jgi:anti-anti-sigma regulatory factor
MFDILFSRKSIAPEMDFRVLSLLPDDIIVISISGSLTADTAKLIEQSLKVAIDDPDRRVMLLCDGMKLDILRSSDLDKNDVTI